MQSRDFVYWLQGYFEILGKSESLTVEQVDCIKRHLSMVFKHEIDPSMGDKEHQKALSGIHTSEDLKTKRDEMNKRLVGEPIKTYFHPYDQFSYSYCLCPQCSPQINC